MNPYFEAILTIVLICPRQAALSDGAKLLKELKKLDDKNLLVEVQLLESKTYHALSNLPR